MCETYKSGLITQDRIPQEDNPGLRVTMKSPVSDQEWHLNWVKPPLLVVSRPVCMIVQWYSGSGSVQSQWVRVLVVTDSMINRDIRVWERVLNPEWGIEKDFLQEFGSVTHLVIQVLFHI